MKQIMGAVLLDAKMDVSSASTKVNDSGFKWVVIRRVEGLIVYWYAFETGYVVSRLSGCGGEVSVLQAMDLHEYQASPVGDIRCLAIEKDYMNASVILDGGRFIGVTPSVPPDFYMDMADVLDRKHESMPTRETAVASWEGDYNIRSVIETAESFMAYPKIDTPQIVTPREHFTLTIGISSQPQSGIIGEISLNLPSSIKHFSLDMLIVADGFDMPEGCRHQLIVDRMIIREQTIQVPLIAPEIIDEQMLTSISVIYFFEKIPCGTGTRKIAVVSDDDRANYVMSMADQNKAGKHWIHDDQQEGSVSIQPGIPAIDLTVILSKPDCNPTSGVFVWTFESPHAVKLPPLPITKNLGVESNEFSKKIISGIQNVEALDMVALGIGGLGKEIADRMPMEFWPLLQDVADTVSKTTPGHPPTVLFLTAETHVPWELAFMEKPLETETPPYLGCQVSMSRWPLSDSNSPALPPEASIDVHKFAVVVGDYAGHMGWRKLEKAESEGNAIESRYKATKLSADPKQIKNLLYGMLFANDNFLAEDPEKIELVHFACHGDAVSGHIIESAIILDQGQPMNPMLFANSPLGKTSRPFLFLNACQVGRADELLCSFSGFAGESLRGGFRGFIAPVWSVDDSLAHDIALEFYDRVIGTEKKFSEPVASVLRDMRKRFSPDTEKNSATRLAYAFYGHPCLTIQRIKEEYHV